MNDGDLLIGPHRFASEEYSGYRTECVSPYGASPQVTPLFRAV